MKTRARLLVVIQFVLFVLLAGAFFFFPDSQGLALRLLGMAVTLLGLVVIGLSIWTHFRANRAMVNVSPEPNASNQLVETGIYARIRHPIYTGVMLAAVGAAVTHGHVAGLVIAILLCIFFAYKSTVEERWLMQVYPTYADYRIRAGRFWPKW